MPNPNEAEIHKLTANYYDRYRKMRSILSFQEFLTEVKERPHQYLRNSVSYLSETFEHFGKAQVNSGVTSPIEHFKLFDIPTEHSGPIIGGEHFQNAVFRVLQRFKDSGHAAKLILLHGPNGSSKSSSVDAIFRALELYSQSDEGALYRFNWIFPTDRAELTNKVGQSQPIGFSQSSEQPAVDSYAHLHEVKIASKITSEFKENPIYLIPPDERIEILTKWIAKYDNTSEDEVIIPAHIRKNGLSKQNQLIFESLLSLYEGDLARVYNHIQVERFYFSKQYRVGISCVEPQVSIDAREQQLTLDKSYSSIPAALQNISFYKTGGELIEANRGILEFSDLLKRPLEAFKYLLSTIERSQISLPSGTANLDIVFFATTNEKHLDAFKTVPDFSSFKGRIELLKVPYILTVDEEMKIYARDLATIERTKSIAPHTLKLLCKWAILTRLKKPEPQYYGSKHQEMIKKMSPEIKQKFYGKESLRQYFSPQEISELEEIREKVYLESRDTSVYEGRFGASPREIKSLLYKASQTSDSPTVTILDIIRELRTLVKDKTVYEFLQFEPREGYHDVETFIAIIEQDFIQYFDKDLAESMELADEEEYDNLLVKYITHVVASIKGEKIFDSNKKSYELPSEKIMNSVESILGISGSKEEHRHNILSKIASHKLDHPEKALHIPEVLDDFLTKIKEHFFQERITLIQENMKMFIAYGNGEDNLLSNENKLIAEKCYNNMEKIGYPKECVRDYLRYRLQTLLTEKEEKKL